MQGGRGRKRRGAHQETLQTQEYSLHSRYPMRRSSTPQLLPISPLGSMPYTPCLRPALRILREDSRAAANATEYDTLYEISVKEEVRTVSSPNATASSIQQKMDGDGPCALPTSPLEVPQDYVDGHVSSTVKPPVLEKCKTYDGPSRTRCLSPSPSLNLTEMARALQEEDDPDEVESSPYERVHGHRVKLEIAPLVRAIFDKHGDITAESDIKSSIIASHILEHVCIVYQKLEQGKFFDIVRGEINDMLEELHFYEKQKVKVGWLLERVQQIFEAKKRTQEYLLIKGEVAKCSEEKKSIEEQIELHRRHMGLIEKKLLAAEQEKEAKEAEKNEHTKKALNIKAQVQAIMAQSLVHGLL